MQGKNWYSLLIGWHTVMLASEWLTQSNACFSNAEGFKVHLFNVFDWLKQNNIRFWLVESSTLNYSWIFSATLSGEAWPAEEHDGTAGQRCWGAGAQTQAHVERICGGKYLLLIGRLITILISDWFLQEFDFLLDSCRDGIEVSYNAAGVLAHMASDGPEVCKYFLLIGWHS